jgi:hypothetical protein
VRLQHGIELCHDRRAGRRVIHHLHGERGLRHEIIQRQHLQHGPQDIRAPCAGQLDQPPGMGGSREVGVGQHQFVAVPHAGQHVQQVG